MLKRSIRIVPRGEDQLYLIFEVIGPEGGLRWEMRLGKYEWVEHGQDPLDFDLVAHSKLPIIPRSEFDTITKCSNCETTGGDCWSDVIEGKQFPRLVKEGSEGLLDHMEERYKEYFQQKALDL